MRELSEVFEFEIKHIASLLQVPNLLESVRDDISEEGRVNGTSVILKRMESASFLRKTTEYVSFSTK